MGEGGDSSSPPSPPQHHYHCTVCRRDEGGDSQHYDITHNTGEGCDGDKYCTVITECLTAVTIHVITAIIMNCIKTIAFTTSTGTNARCWDNLLYKVTILITAS